MQWRSLKCPKLPVAFDTPRTHFRHVTRFMQGDEMQARGKGITDSRCISLLYPLLLLSSSPHSQMFSAVTLHPPVSCFSVSPKRLYIIRSIVRQCSVSKQAQRAHKIFTRPYHILQRKTTPRMSFRDEFFSSRLQKISRAYGTSAYNPTRSSNMILWSTIGISAAVFGAWQYGATGGAPAGARGWFGQGAVRPTTPQMVQKFLSQNFLLTSQYVSMGRYWTMLTSAVSHRDINHLLGNMFSLHAFSSVLIYAVRSPVHVASLFVGSALAGSIGFVLQQSNSSSGRYTYGLGASGMVMGVGVAAAMLVPRAQMLIFGIVPARLWMLLGGYIAWDSFYLSSPQSTVGHAAHLGGAAFGALYYTLFLRRFGGILKLR